ncbi:ImmA/IrrE family metallo-endopeptidase [Edaphobacillus lindanitolerans]|uniref:IrrE N-terminal-like domain-containing protein n=1 Tax=Edaphobacillus lindanitolerans TaxID=550447 RepID=A0A1U7PMY8_9BACI|nr:ImmA/IrrE family metallo-endopeptidase [Edaphobacillus lindanitolerans]SIT91468.1 protein of unknown function [Edaphobacillus lindanitolerans]
MKYTYTTIEEYVNVMYESIEIYHPRLLDPSEIAARLRLSTEFVPAPSIYRDGVIYIDERQSEERQWQEYCHELCHAMWHVGNQVCLPPPFKEYQEEKAQIFARHACIPSAMLMQLDIPDHEDAAVDMLCTTFCVEPEFARERLQQYIRNHLQRGWCSSS